LVIQALFLVVFVLVTSAWTEELKAGQEVGTFSFQPSRSTTRPNGVDYNFQVTNTGPGMFSGLTATVYFTNLLDQSFHPTIALNSSGITNGFSSLTLDPVKSFLPTIQRDSARVALMADQLWDDANTAGKEAAKMIAEQLKGAIEDIIIADVAPVVGIPKAFNDTLSDIADMLDLVLKIQDVFIDQSAWTANKSLLATDQNVLYNLSSLTFLPHSANMGGSYIVDSDPSVFSNLIIGDMFTPVSSPIIVTPEPSTILLFVFGIGCLVSVKYRVMFRCRKEK
jgi:hypothetical protein